MGLRWEDEDGEHRPQDFELWPENWQPVLVYASMQSQRIVGMNGFEGFRYEALEYVMRRKRVPTELEDDVFWAFQIMERYTRRQAKRAAKR